MSLVVRIFKFTKISENMSLQSLEDSGTMVIIILFTLKTSV